MSTKWTNGTYDMSTSWTYRGDVLSKEVKVLVSVDGVLKLVKAHRRFWALDRKYSGLLSDNNDLYREIFELHEELQDAYKLDDDVVESIIDINFDKIEFSDEILAERITNYYNNKERLV